MRPDAGRPTVVPAERIVEGEAMRSSSEVLLSSVIAVVVIVKQIKVACLHGRPEGKLGCITGAGLLRNWISVLICALSLSQIMGCRP